MNNEPLAKPKGTTLKEHIENVTNEAKKIIQKHSFVIKKYEQLTGKSLERRLKVAAKFHDDGKKHLKWQIACKKENEIYLQTQKVNGGYLQKTGIRHEMESLYLHQNDKYPFSEVLKISIAAHHGKLGQSLETRWEKDENGKYKEFWNEFKRLSYTTFDLNYPENFSYSILKNYEFAGVRSYLQLADHRASILEDKKEIPEFGEFDYRFNLKWERKNVQKIAEDNWQDELLLLRAPTGSGKTDAALLWAKKQIENDKADRLVIAMPTRFTSNALSINVASSLSETGLYHSSAWFVRHFETAKKSYEAEHKAKLQHEFARLLETPVTICTIDHLLISLTHSREDHHSITFNLAHSCVVIDEADFYDEFTQANILQLLKVLKLLEVPVLIMSASLPQSSLELYQSTGFKPKEIKEDTSENLRIRCSIENIKKYKVVNELQDLLVKSLDQPTIIYANTVAKAVEFYQWFKNRGKLPVLYHSRFTEPDKLKKEELLLDDFGKEAWRHKKANGIAILTQIGEMSVNISADYMITDICPIDRLVQRIGRLSRFEFINATGKLNVIIPFKDNEVYPAPYGNYIMKKGWTMSKPLEDTINLLQPKSYNAFELVDLVNKIYKELPKFSSRTEINADKLKDHIIDNWLILPLALTEQDEENTHVWKSRDIDSQVDIYVLDPYDYLEKNLQRFKDLEKNKHKECFFDNYKEFMYFRNQYVISCPNYLFQKARKNGKVYQRNKIWIGDNKESKSIWCTSNYDSDLGLVLDDKDNF
ncbi:MAG: CRISPR-associated helicase Cas3' [Chitinophagales bacterium]|nr:CRISPR-associated helicase Cas3' [Chitinophagales bacterium]